MPQNVETEMLLITSDDYWGHAGDFDPAVNFYPYTFIITQSQYASMDDSDKGRFFPCALFYYAGETDNHGFQPRRIGCRVEDNDTVSMGRVMGINRQGDQEVRTYRLGTEQGYAIPGYASMSMLKGEGDSYEAIESAAEAGSLPVGGFDISGLIYNQEAVVDTINTVAGIETDDSAAENFSAEEATPFEYDGAEPEAYVARPEATPVGYDVDDNSAAVEDYFASEGYNFNHTVGDFAQDSAAGSGYGVPEYYGTNSMSPMAFEAEVMYGTDGSVVGQAVGNWDSTPFGYQAEGDEGPEVMWEQDEFVSVRDGSARDAIADEYLDLGEDYDDAEDYARRAAKKMSAEGLGDYTGPLTNGFGENSASVSDYGVPVWYGSAEESQDWRESMSDEEAIQILKELQDAELKDGWSPETESGFHEQAHARGKPNSDTVLAVYDKYGVKKVATAMSLSNSRPTLRAWAQKEYGAEEAYNGMGENSASISGQGVPQWYGSAEEKRPMSLTNYTDEQLLSQFQMHHNWLLDNGFTTFQQIVPDGSNAIQPAISHLEDMARIATAMGFRGQQRQEFLDMEEALMNIYAAGAVSHSSLNAEGDEDDWTTNIGHEQKKVRNPDYEVWMDRGGSDGSDYTCTCGMTCEICNKAKGLCGKNGIMYSPSEDVVACSGCRRSISNAEEFGPGVGMPAVDDGFYPNSYGEDSSTFGQGVPQWYGSAEQGYNDKMDESLGMRHRGSHSQSMKDRRDEAAAMDKRHSRMGRKYDDVMTMDAEPVVKVQKSETKMAMAIGAAVLGALTAYTISLKVGGSDEPEEPEEPEE